MTASHQFLPNDTELLDIVGAFQGTDMGENDPDVEDEEFDEVEEDDVTEQSALEHFAAILQKAHDAAVTAERDCELR